MVAGRWYPSRKTCSDCTTTKAKLSLRERVFHCGACGLVMDRDENAARNLAALVAAVAGTPVCSMIQSFVQASLPPRVTSVAPNAALLFILPCPQPAYVTAYALMIRGDHALEALPGAQSPIPAGASEPDGA
ncbi:zinc ribbon domain-containing protein [Streptomyces sp. NPDC006333]|uniref:zinc ribbon domain-containing protein n=1 Tax=Streptomyces sp. NPDC006333 TaxID=3156753 RepID=UPI0033B586E5